MAIQITSQREEKLKRIVALTQQNLSIVLENVHDSHNIGAVVRSCDAVGVREIFIVDTNKAVQEKKRIQKASSTGVSKWMVIHHYNDLIECMNAVKSKYEFVFGTHLGSESKSLYDVDFTQSMALVFGNEHAGLTDEMLALCDGNFIIPQMGMVQSLNISVACAVSLFEAQRQRINSNSYNEVFDSSNPLHMTQYNAYLENQLKSKVPKKRYSKNDLRN